MDVADAQIIVDQLRIRAKKNPLNGETEIVLYTPEGFKDLPTIRLVDGFGNDYTLSRE